MLIYLGNRVYVDDNVKLNAHGFYFYYRWEAHFFVTSDTMQALGSEYRVSYILDRVRVACCSGLLAMQLLVAALPER